MFVLCPYCQFLVAIDPASGQPPPRCPRCRGLLVPETQTETETKTETGTEAATQDATQVAAMHEPAAGDDADMTAPIVVDAGGEPPPVTPDVDDVVAVEAVDPDVADASLASAPAPTRARTRARTKTPTKPRTKTRGRTPAPAPTLPPATTLPGSPPAPGFVHRQRARVARTAHTRGWMIVAIAGLSLLLVLQLLLADRAELARDARWRPSLSMLCGALHCSLPAWREPTAFVLLDRDVRPRPGFPGVLHVTATFRNDARWPQPWPALLLTLSDLDGRPAGARVFAPEEYLGATPTQDTLTSGQSAMMSMDVVEPGSRIVAFTFDFR